jgi:hypothetical protein
VLATVATNPPQTEVELRTGLAAAAAALDQEFSTVHGLRFAWSKAFLLASTPELR